MASLLGHVIMYNVIEMGNDDTRFALKPIRRATYHGLETVPLPVIQLAQRERGRGTVVYHVTKEFGPASFGGLGSVVTTLATMQAQRGAEVHVVMPAYSYLLRQPVASEIGLEKQPEMTVHLSFRYRRRHDRTSNETILADVPIYHARFAGVTLHLIGASEHVWPLNLAFRAETKREIYSFVDELKWEIRDTYFTEATVAFFQQQLEPVTAVHQQEQMQRRRPLVHFHGATHALALPRLRRSSPTFAKGAPGAPALLYTIHDYHDEFQYRLSDQSYEHFFDLTALGELYDSSLRDGRIYTSYFGAHHADVVSIVSVALAKQLARGDIDYHNRMVAEPAIIPKIEGQRFFGISNGVDFSKFDPFHNTDLQVRGLEFNRRGQISNYKRQAKQYLVKEGLLRSENTNKPLVLFVGRFQGNKGITFCVDVSRLSSKLGFVFVLMGQHAVHSRHFTDQIEGYGGIIIDDDGDQANWGMALRAAADIAFVPSRTEAFGLVAAEALAMGAIVVSSGVGGLADFLVDRKAAQTLHGFYNAFLFTLGSYKSLETAITEALEALASMSISEREQFIRSLIDSAFRLSWDEPNGALDQYATLYEWSRTIAEMQEFQSLDA